jgi:hypothetical protein
MHHNPAHPWTLAELAREVGSSRAALARRFHELVGEPPMTFLAGWRIARAADVLREPGPRRRGRHLGRLYRAPSGSLSEEVRNYRPSLIVDCPRPYRAPRMVETDPGRGRQMEEERW